MFLGFFVLKLCVLRIALCLWEFLNPEEDDDDDDDFILLFYFLIYKLWFSFLEVCLLSRVCIELKIIFCCWKVPLSMCFFLPVKLHFFLFFFFPPFHKQAHKSCLWQVFFPALGSMVQHSLGSTCKPSSFQQEELFRASIFSDLLCVSKKQNFKKATNHVHFCGFTWIVLYYRKSYYPPFSHHNNNFISRE